MTTRKMAQFMSIQLIMQANTLEGLALFASLIKYLYT